MASKNHVQVTATLVWTRQIEIPGFAEMDEAQRDAAWEEVRRDTVENGRYSPVTQEGGWCFENEQFELDIEEW